VSRALSTAASALLETVARLALVAIVLVALALRLVLVLAVRAAKPRAASDLHTAALGRFPNPPSA
jgi:hypothetical protein